MQFRLVGAIEQRDIRHIRRLIDSGVNIDCVILYSKSPLIHAIEQKYTEVVELLVESGADLEKGETLAWQRRPIHFAVLSNSLAVAEMLLKRGVKANSQDGCGMTPLHHACFLGYRDQVNLLLQYGSSVHQGDFIERDALHRAVEGKHWDIAEHLMSYKISVNGRDKFGWTPLYQSIMSNDLEGAGFLISRGADVNVKDKKGDTPLHIACDRLSRANVRIMLSASVDFYRRMRRIPTSEIQQLLQDENTSQLDMVELLVNTGADLNAINDFLTRPVHMKPEPRVMKYLILSGAFIDYDMVLLIHLFEASEEMAEWLEEEFGLQTTLQRLCRFSIRAHLRHTRDIKMAVKRLPLPKKLIDYLNMSELEYR